MIEHVPWWSLLAGYALGWLMGRLDRETQDDHRRRINHENRNGPVGSPPLKLRRSEPDPWQRQHLIRVKGFRIPPPQPLTADLIRYWQWQDEQVRQALEEGTNPPPGEAS